MGNVPDLEQAVTGIVRYIHPLAAEPGYDVSHSQPRWRDRIFLSCPERMDEVGALRLAEGVLHEAMHLLLTDEEERDYLVSHPAAELLSPWRKEQRLAGGVLHGFFVFACIRLFMVRLSSGTVLGAPGRIHVEGRIRETGAELASVDVARLSACLTPRGVAAIAAWQAAAGMSGPGRETLPDSGTV